MLISIEGLDGAGKTTAEQVIVNQYSSDNILTTEEPYEGEWIGQKVREAIADSKAHPLSTLLLFISDHSYHYKNVIAPALNDGKIVITDRYIDSRYAYQGHGIKEFIDGDPIKFIQTLQETEWEIDHSNIDVGTILKLAEIEMPKSIYQNTPKIGRYFYGLSMLDTPSFNTEFVLGETSISDPTDFPGLVPTQNSELTWTKLPETTIYLDADVDVCVGRLSPNTEDRERFEFKEFLHAVKSNYEKLADSTDRFYEIDANQEKDQMIQDIRSYFDQSACIRNNNR